jgi:hypothetical protein
MYVRGYLQGSENDREISSRCNLTARIEPVQDKYLYMRVYLFITVIILSILTCFIWELPFIESLYLLFKQ